MRAVRFQRFIDCLKPLQCVISTYPIIGKRAFVVACNNPQSTIYIDVRNVHGHLDASSSSESRYSSEASNNKYQISNISLFSYISCLLTS